MCLSVFNFCFLAICITFLLASSVLFKVSKKHCCATQPNLIPRSEEVFSKGRVLDKVSWSIISQVEDHVRHGLIVSICPVLLRWIHRKSVID